MCGLYTNRTVKAWLENQLSVLGCWTEDIMMNPEADISLIECLKTHQKWLESELLILNNPSKYRLSNFALAPVYPLIEIGINEQKSDF